MENITKWENTMTIFYSKNTGKIKAVCQGIQSFDYFGEDRLDMEIILDKIEAPFSEQVLYNQHFFAVKDGTIEFNNSVINNLRGII